MWNKVNVWKSFYLNGEFHLPTESHKQKYKHCARPWGETRIKNGPPTQVQENEITYLKRLMLENRKHW